MTNILMLAFSIKGYETMKCLEMLLDKEEFHILKKVKCDAVKKDAGTDYLEGTLASFLEETISDFQVVCFFSATGIAVRSMAPFIEHKAIDPAVIVIDEMGQFCIPILSGHMGGANDYAKKFAGLLHAIPVITTATDVEHKFAIDEFARKNDLYISDWELAKNITKRILEGKVVSFTSELPIQTKENIPKELLYLDKEKKNTYFWGEASKEVSEEVCFHIGKDFIPKNIIVGIGCKKNTPVDVIQNAMKKAFDLVNKELCEQQILMLASIDLKKNESGIIEYCKKNRILFCTYSAEELRKVPGDFSVSDFVRETTGVENVCERSALKAALAYEKQKKMDVYSRGAEEQTDIKHDFILKKHIFDGVTVSLVKVERKLVF